MAGYIDVNSPNFFSQTQAAVDQYGSPEAAQQDMEENASQATDLYRKKYQALTGDAFSDPFKDAIKARDSALMSAVIAGKNGFVAPNANAPTPQLSVNIGGQMGPTVNDATQVMAQKSAVNSARVATLQATTPPPILPSLSGPTTRQLPGQPQSQFALSDPTQEAQRQRANALGVNDIFTHLLQNNPKALSLTDPTDPELQKDIHGKPVAGDQLNPHLFSDPKFQELLKTQPDRARKLYEALYDRNFDTDLAAQRGANTKRTDVREKVLGGLSKTLMFDDITGEPKLRTFQRDPITQELVEGNPRPLSAIEQNALNQNGGFESQFGFKPPPRANLTPEEADKLRSTRDEILKNNPNMPKDVALLHARKKLSMPPPLLTAPPAGGGGARTFSAIDDLLRAGPNAAIGGVNALLRGNASGVQIPEVPHVDAADVKGTLGNIFDWLKEQGKEHVWSSSGSGNLALR